MIFLPARLLAAIALLIALNQLHDASAQQPHDLKLIADQPVVALWVSPAEHLKNPAAAELFKAIVKTAPETDRATVAAAVPKIDWYKMSMIPGKRSFSEHDVPVGVMAMHLTDVTATKPLFEMMTKNYKPRAVSELAVPLYQSPISRILYPKEKSEPEDKWILSPATVLLNPQTIALGGSAEKLIAVTSAKEPATDAAWGSAFKSLASSQSLLLIDTVKLRVMLDAELKRYPPRGAGAMFMSSLKPLYEESDYALLALDTTEGLKLTGLAKSATPEAALRFKGALAGAIAMGKGMLPMVKPLLLQLNLPEENIDKAYKEIEIAINGLSITQDGTTTKLSLHIKQDCVSTVVAGIFIPLLEEQQRRMEEFRERIKKVEGEIELPELPEAKARAKE